MGYQGPKTTILNFLAHSDDLLYMHAFYCPKTGFQMSELDLRL